MRLLQISAYALAGGLTLGLIAFGIAGGWFELDLQRNGFQLGFTAVILILLGATIHLHRKQSRFAVAAKLVVAFVALCFVIHFVGKLGEPLDSWGIAYDRPSTLAIIASYLGLTWATLATAIAVIAMTFIVKWLTGERLIMQGTANSLGTRVRWGLALGVLLTWSFLETMVGLVLPSVTSKLDDLQVIEYAPFLTLFLLTASLRKERWVVDSAGVKFVLGTRTIFCAKWRRILRIVVIHNAHEKQTFIVHYRTRLLIPFSLVFRPDHVEGGAAMSDLIRGAAMEEGLKVVHLRASRGVIVAGWASILAGCALIPIKVAFENSLNYRYIDGQFTAANFGDFAAVLPLSAMYLGSIALLSLGFGLNSGARFGGSRVFLLAVLLVGTYFIPGSTLHWLVWCAIHAIESATMTPFNPSPALEYPPLLELGFDVMTWGFTIAPVFFWIGVAAGRRRWRPQEEPLPIATAQTTEEREEPMLVAS